MNPNVKFAFENAFISPNIKTVTKHINRLKIGAEIHITASLILLSTNCELRFISAPKKDKETYDIFPENPNKKII